MNFANIDLSNALLAIYSLCELGKDQTNSKNGAHIFSMTFQTSDCIRILKFADNFIKLLQSDFFILRTGTQFNVLKIEYGAIHGPYCLA